MKFVAPILIILIMTQIFSKWIMIAEYNINRNYIARVLCENRNRPKLHCNGKCMLMKKMAEEEDRSSTPGTIKLNWETFLFIDNHSEYSNKYFSQNIERYIPLNLFYCNRFFSSSVFRPPIAGII